MGRFSTAWKAFWKILGSDEAARAWQESAAPAGLPPPSSAPLPATGQEVPADAVYSLVLLQRAGRLVDFLAEDISPYTDAQVGAAVRQIHAKCRTVLEETFHLQPILGGTEGATVRIEPGFDPSRISLTGNVKGAPPFAGTLRHPGWKVGAVDFPDRNSAVDPAVIAPAEVEL